MKISDNKHGGKRLNAGAKKKYGEHTETVSFRVPESKVTDVKEAVKTMLKEWVVIK